MVILKGLNLHSFYFRRLDLIGLICDKFSFLGGEMVFK